MTDWLTTRPIAHRGLHNPTTLIENSLEAFQAAIDYNYPIELDLHLSKDGEVIVFHDHSLQRLTGKNAYIWDLTLPEIKALRLGATNAAIPTLKEVIDLVNGKTIVFGIFKRNGHVYTEIVPDCSKATIQAVIRGKVAH